MNDEDDGELKKPSKELSRSKNEGTSTTFDLIEKEFSTVMKGLGGDKKLLPFRVQHEKLFQALKKSIQHEKFLAEKCNELSSEVTHNVSKVRDALKLSQQDQNAIVMLKQDTEKAWMLVQEGGKKERTISETVDRLQDEANKLSQQLQTERTRTMKQDEDLVRTSEEKNNLVLQRDEYLHKIDGLERRERAQEVRLNTLEDTAQKLRKENISILAREKIRTDELVASKKKVENSEAEVVSFKSKLKQKTQDHVDLQWSLSLAKGKEDQGTKDLKEANKKAEKRASECEALSQQTEHLTEMLELQRNKMVSINEGFQKNEGELKTAMEANNRITSEKSQLQRKYDSEHRNVLRLQQAMGDAKSSFQLLKKEMQSLKQAIDKSNKREDQILRESAVLKREKDLLREKIQRYEHKSKGSNDDLLHNKQAMETLEKELSNARSKINSLNKEISSLGTLSEKHNNDLSQERKSAQRTKDEVRLQDVELQELKKELNTWETKSLDETQMCNQLRVERGKLSRQLICAQEEVKQLKDEINVAGNEDKNLRREASVKDENLVKERFETKQEKAQKEHATSELSRLKRHLLDQEGTIQKQDLMIRRFNSMLKEMDDDAFSQRKEYDQIVNERDVLGAQLIRRNDELALMQKRMKMQESTLKKGEIQYQERIDEIRLLKNAYQDLRRELNLKKDGSGDEGRISKELMHTEKSLVKEKVKVKALSEELENPLNVHRWRKLEGSDPTAFELIQKIELLQKRLIKKSEQVCDLLASEKTIVPFLLTSVSSFLGNRK